VPSMRRKGRIQVGCDADLVVFDPTAVTDLAGYDRPSRPAAGMSHVMVAGDLVVDDGELLPDVRAGRWIASEVRT
jgi:N-acyl-D-aspartate/D-glutamate deacylase